MYKVQDSDTVWFFYGSGKISMSRVRSGSCRTVDMRVFQFWIIKNRITGKYLQIYIKYTLTRIFVPNNQRREMQHILNSLFLNECFVCFFCFIQGRILYTRAVARFSERGCTIKRRGVWDFSILQTVLSKGKKLSKLMLKSSICKVFSFSYSFLFFLRGGERDQTGPLWPMFHCHVYFQCSVVILFVAFTLTQDFVEIYTAPGESNTENIAVICLLNHIRL